MESVSIDWVKIDNEDCYRFSFTGHFKAIDAKEAAKQWKEHFAKTPAGRRYHIIFDAREMSNYDASARLTWQAVMKELQGKIKDIWLVSNNSLIKVGAKMMSMFTSFKIKAVSNLEDISLQAALIK